MILVMQYLENLSDRQASQAVQGRIDWKYALSLELTAPGFDFTVLSEFRDLRQLPAVEVLRQVWLQQYYVPTDKIQCSYLWGWLRERMRRLTGDRDREGKLCYCWIFDASFHC
jgi:Transposase domain (DUF772)